ncbi:MAG: hypothetical protein PF542_04505 [Nanoarchaeota archaeon]|jgi:hypothetical protein|nr:hypothetical protein [Nanoarchaeota archaeon]
MEREFVFKYSTIYDKNWALALGKEYNRQENKQIVENFIEQLSKVWDPKEDEILDAIAFHSNLKWRNKKVKIYFVSNLKVTGFSDPLTIRISENKNRVVKTLIHEAVHEIFLQNEEELKQVYVALDNKFPDENIKTKVHVLVNAITEKVFGKLFGKEESEKIKAVERQFIGLKRAYDIIESIEIKDDVICSILDI